jgi:transcriptional regulator with XRE-family HTH domain
MIKESDKALLAKLGVRLNKLRTEKQLSLRQLADLSDVDFSKIGKIEKGQVNITFTTLVALSKALDVLPKDFLNFKLN